MVLDDLFLGVLGGAGLVAIVAVGRFLYLLSQSVVDDRTDGWSKPKALAIALVVSVFVGNIASQIPPMQERLDYMTESGEVVPLDLPHSPWQSGTRIAAFCMICMGLGIAQAERPERSNRSSGED